MTDLPIIPMECVLCGKTIAYCDEEPTEKRRESTICKQCYSNELQAKITGYQLERQMVKSG